VFELVWSDDLLAEVERVLVQYKSLPPDRAAYFCDCIRDAFPDGRIVRADYADLIASRSGPDADDHVHSAAAVAGGATVVLSADHRGFPAVDIAPAHRRHPDAYLTEILHRHRDMVLGVVDDMGASLRVPRRRAEVLDALGSAGLTRFVAEARS
jgi:hypothetical protein